MRWGTSIVDRPESYPDGPLAVRVDNRDTDQLTVAARELEAHLLHEQALHLAEVRAMLAELHQRDGVQVQDADLDTQAEQVAQLDCGDRFLYELATHIYPGSELLELARQLDDHALGVWREAAGSLVDDCPPSLAHLRWRVEEEQRAELRSHAHLVRSEGQLGGLLRRLGLVLGASATGKAPVVFAAIPDDPERRALLPPLSNGVTRIARDQFERFADLGGEVLAAPISVVARALNILSTSGKGRRESAITIVGLCVRPVMPVTEPAELAANIAAFAYRRATTSSRPAELLDQLRRAAAHRLGVLLTAPRQFSALPPAIQRDLVAGLLVDLVQLVGRARRGQTKAEVHFIDGALHNTRWNSDLPSLIRLLYESWDDHERQLMHQVYGATLAVLLDYAGITTP